MTTMDFFNKCNKTCKPNYSLFTACQNTRAPSSQSSTRYPLFKDLHHHSHQSPCTWLPPHPRVLRCIRCLKTYTTATRAHTPIPLSLIRKWGIALPTSNNGLHPNPFTMQRIRDQLDSHWSNPETQVAHPQLKD